MFASTKDILDFNKLKIKHLEILKEIEVKKQKYCYLCIAVRPYLWT
jgi:hypothetical protein